MTLEQLQERLQGLSVDPAKFCGHYSDQNLMIRKTGTEEVYAAAVDLLPCDHLYEETDTKIDEPILPQNTQIHTLQNCFNAE